MQGRAGMRGIMGGGGSGGSGLTLPSSELNLTHTADIPITTGGYVNHAPSFTDIISGEPWATDDGNGGIHLSPGLYWSEILISYTQIASDRDFAIDVSGGFGDFGGILASFHVTADTSILLVASGLHVNTTAGTLAVYISGSSVHNPALTITEYSMFMSKIV